MEVGTFSVKGTHLPLAGTSEGKRSLGAANPPPMLRMNAPALAKG